MARMGKAKAELRSLWYGMPASDTESTARAAEAQRSAGPLGISRAAWIVGAVLVVAFAAFALFAWIGDQRADDRRTDTYYCTLSGVGPFDRAPNTGERCIDLMED